MKKILFLLLFVSLFLTGCKSKTIIDGVNLSDYTKTDVSIETTVDGGGRVESFVIDDVELSDGDNIYLVIDETAHIGTFVGVAAGNTIFTIDELIGEVPWDDAETDNSVYAYYEE